jgi:hypothetical protein
MQSEAILKAHILKNAHILCSAFMQEMPLDTDF